jgi:dihydrofolate reductase
MRPLTVFNNVSLDGYFVDAKGDMSWAHEAGAGDPEFEEYTASNARGGEGTLLFGRKTYEMMESFWTTDEAKQQMPDIAEGMNRLEKVVFSRTLRKTSWNNATLLSGDLVIEVTALKERGSDPITIMGSGTIVAQLAKADLIDRYTFVIVPVVLGAGRTLFEGLSRKITLKRTSERLFASGIVVATYEPAPERR